MKIEKKDKNIMEFRDLESGECFCCKTEVYIKTKNNREENVNAVNLNYGICCCFKDDIAVQRLNAKVVIE